MYLQTHDREGRRNEWPDGGAYLDQPAMLLDIFSIIRTEQDKLRQEEAKRVKRN